MSQKKETVLIVDDSWVIRQYLRSLIENNTDFDIEEAVDGQDALRKIEANPPSCILLDLLMPNMDGMEAFSIMKEKNLNIPTIFLSADIQETTKKRSFEMGAFDFINKPPQEDKLLEVVHRAIAQKAEA